MLRKISKSLGVKNAKIAGKNRQIKSLQYQIRKLRPTKRAKAVPKGPHSRFIEMKDVKKVKERVAAEQAKKRESIKELGDFDIIVS